MRLRRIAAGVLTTGLVLGTAGATAADSARAEVDWLGVNTGSAIRVGGVAPAQFYDRLTGMGGNLLREDIGWNVHEPTNDGFDWTTLDLVINNAPPGVGVVLVVHHSPQWARDPLENLLACLGIPQAGCRMPPATNMLPEWQEFIRTAVSRYQDRVVGVEVWNEPNYKNFWRMGNASGAQPARWATLVVAAAEAVAEIDPAIPIVTGGVGPARCCNELVGMMQGTYLDAAYSAVPELANVVDAVGVHPYPGQRAPDDDESPGSNLYLATFNEIPDVVEAHDPGTPLWVTETGFYTAGGPLAVTEAQQAEWLMQIYDDLDLRSDVDVEAMVIHTLYNQPWQLRPQGRHFGMLYANGDPKPAWTAFHDRFAP